MNVLISHIFKSFNGDEVFGDVTFSITEGERIALIGKNGAGKSTILKIIAGLEAPDSGTCIFPPDFSIGYIPQAHEAHVDDTVFDVLTEHAKEHYEEHELLSSLSTFMLEDYLHSPLSSLSSGQKTKIYLARLLMKKTDLLLLDEPTNHLDTEGLEWLETYLKKYPGAILFVSHDRMFLDRVAQKIIELENGTIHIFGGNYSFYKHQKEIQRQAYELRYTSQQSEIQKLEEEQYLTRQKGQVKNKIKKKKGEARAAAGFFANRQSQIFGAHAKNIQRKIERIDTLDKPESIPELKALFSLTKESGNLVYSIKNATKYFDTLPILNDVTLYIFKHDRIALLGNNGSGKSTLIHCLLGKIALDEGTIQKGTNVKEGYLSQEHSDLMTDNSVIDELIDKTKKTETECYQLLSRFLIPVEKVRQPVSTLSSGEKSKLLLSEIMASGSNFIILDEPTNHLDIPSREALEEAISNYEGTLLVISHDRYFLNRIGITRKIQLLEGNLSESSLDLS